MAKSGLVASKKLDSTRPSTIAAMWTGAIVNRSRRNSNEENGSFDGTNVSFKSIWKDTPLEKLADICEEHVENLSPRLENPTTSINIDKVKQERKRQIESGAPEVLVFAGPNGSGKDFAINHVHAFLDFLGIKTNIIKMPNPNGQLFDHIDKFLHGKVHHSPISAQLLFLSDAFDSEISTGSLNIFNRHATVEAGIFGPRELQPTILSTHPLTGYVMHTIIIDRAPVIAQEMVKKRKVDPRAFEKKIDQTIEQRIRYAEITKLPGFRFLNLDFRSKNNDPEQQVRSINRILSNVLQIGIIQRILVKESKAKNIAEASDILNKAYWNFKAKKDIWLDTVKQ